MTIVGLGAVRTGPARRIPLGEERVRPPLIPMIFADPFVILESCRSSRCRYDPMSATLGALVIAIATEFSVLLSARRYPEEMIKTCLCMATANKSETGFTSKIMRGQFFRSWRTECTGRNLQHKRGWRADESEYGGVDS